MVLPRYYNSARESTATQNGSDPMIHHSIIIFSRYPLALHRTFVKKIPPRQARLANLSPIIKTNPGEPVAALTGWTVTVLILGHTC